MSRILQLCSWPPYPPDHGGAVASWYLARCLRHNGFDVDLLCFARRRGELDRHREALSRVYASVHAVEADLTRQHPTALARALLAGRSYFVEKYGSRELERALEALLSRSRYAATLIDNAYMGVYLDALARHRAAAGAWILRPLNVEHEIFERLAARERRRPLAALLRREARHFREHEASLARRCDQVWAITRRDADRLSELSGRSVDVLDPCLDLSEYAPAGAEEVEAGAVVFVGSLSWPPNRNGLLWFHREVWPRIRKEHPEARLHVVGRDPGPEVRALAGEDVSVTGYVEDVRPYFRRAHAFVVPLLEGSGVRIKIVMALAMGKRVLATPLGAEGVDYPGLRLAETAGDWAARLGAELSAPPRVDREAVDFARRHYDWRRPLRLGRR